MEQSRRGCARCGEARWRSSPTCSLDRAAQRRLREVCLGRQVFHHEQICTEFFHRRLSFVNSLSRLGTLLCCDFCNVVWHPQCLDPPMKGVTTVCANILGLSWPYSLPLNRQFSFFQAKYWACDECSEDMWCAYAGIRRPRKAGRAPSLPASPPIPEQLNTVACSCFAPTLRAH